MANDATSGRKNKDNASNNSENKLVGKGSSSRGSGNTDGSTRSSVLETSSKQKALSPASTRKSERLEMRTPSTPPAKRKSVRLEQQNNPTPLKRSERCSSTSRSRYLGRESNSSITKKEENREKTAKKLTTEFENVSTSKKNAAASVGLKRKRLDGRTYKLLFKKQYKGGTASDHCEDDGIDGEHGSKSPSSLLREEDLVAPEERGILFNEQKSLHIHLKAEIAKLFGVIKVSEVIKHTAEKFLEYIMENHRVSKEPETILQAFQISLSWIAASIAKQKIDKDDIFLLVKQQLQFRCTKEEANNVYLKLRSLKKIFLQRLDQNAPRYPISSVKSVKEEPYKGSMSQTVVSTLLNVKTDIKDRLLDKGFSGEGSVIPKEKLMDSQREKVFKKVQCRLDRQISMLGQKQLEKIEEFHRIWEKKKEELEKEYRMEIAVLRSIHGQTAATKDRQKALETEFARKMEEHKCLKDKQLKELEANFSAMRNEEMHNSHYAVDELHLLGSDSGDGMRCSEESLNVSDSNPKTVTPVCGQHVELQCPDNVVSGMHGDVTASDAPASSQDECHVLPVLSTNVFEASVSEEQAEITTTGRALVAAIEQSNEAGNSGGSGEEIACKVPLLSKEHTGEVASDERSRDCSLEISEAPLNKVVEHDQISEINNINQELGTENNIPENNSDSLTVDGNQRDEISFVDGNQLTPEESPADLPCLEAVPSSDNACSLRQNSVHLDECSRSSGDNGSHDNNVLLSGNQIGIQTELISGRTINNTSEAMLADSCEQHRTVGADVPIATHHTHRESASQTHVERNFIPIPGSSPHAAEPLHQAVSPAGENLVPRASVVSNISVTCNQSILPAVSRVHPQSITDLRASSQNTETAFQLVHSSAELSSQAVSQHNVNVAFFQGSNNMPVHPAHQMATWNSALPFHSDPLHIIWERAHKEREQVTKGHEDMKLHLRAECEKEIEVVAASIRKKYDLKLQEAEAAYLLKKNELDMNQKIVLMNKALANAFRFKCIDLEVTGRPVMQEVVPPAYMQHQVWWQHSLRSSPMTGSSSASEQASALACLRSSPISGLSSARLPVGGQPTPVPYLPVADYSIHSGGTSRPTLRSPPAADQQTAAFSHSTAFPTGIVTRPPLISIISPSRGNPRLGGDIRAPAPHLQPFRVPTSTLVSSSSTLPNGVQGHPRPVKVAASSCSHPQLSSLRSTSVPLQVLHHEIQPPIVPQLAVNLSNSGSTSLDHGLGGMPAIQNAYLSARELLLDMENQSRANRPNFMLPLSDIGCNIDSVDLSDFHSLGSVQGGSSSAGKATNVPVRKSQKLWRSRKITDKIAVLQKLVSPRAKADAAASVLHEAYNSIKALQDQIQNLCNMESTSHNSDSLFHAQNSRGEQIDLQSKGICVVPLPVSLMQKLTDEDVFSENMQS
ncbi:helicase protein MOM1-like isoform X2 [Nicotiana tomentosiformis]|uniref:helicase protein MOM1-like isoform X2 n=1 Tax=Nicotiana tomentosiformis TaxID=4098 RepID=UPI00051B3BA5|nr:helicase protein MOM1-like isoform X2 [Nicotiana tomentosiformis]